MSFDERIAALIQRLPKLVDHLQTEESTKNALVMPFISALGYDVFNPQEVVPEYTADVGLKKGEKVDYAILRDGEIIMLIECKKAGTNLSEADAGQLYRYFSVTKARIAVLTNGVEYRFYSDLEEPNKMDTRPFLELSLDDPKRGSLAEVKKLAKGDFDLDEMLSAANEMKYTSEIKKVMASQMEDPEEELVRFFFTRVSPEGARFAASARAMFTPLVPKAFQQYISDKVSDRLRSALQSENTAAEKTEAEVVQEAEKSDIVTTEEELEGYRIVRAIVCRLVSPDRVTSRDAKTYMSVLLDDNNRKSICRLWFNAKQRYLGVFDEHKQETRIPIDAVADIYRHADVLIETVRRYESQ